MVVQYFYGYFMIIPPDFLFVCTILQYILKNPGENIVKKRVILKYTNLMSQTEI